MRCHDEVSIFCRERFYLKWKFTVLQTFFACSRTQSKNSTIFSGDTNNKDDGGNDSNTMIFYLLLCGRTVKQILSGLAWYVRHATHKMLLFHFVFKNIIINKTKRNIRTIRVFAGTLSKISGYHLCQTTSNKGWSNPCSSNYNLQWYVSTSISSTPTDPLCHLTT